MDAFQPLPLAAFEHDRQRMWQQMRPINNNMSDEDLWRYIDSEISDSRSAEMQYLSAFLEPFATEAISITILAHALAEATINAALAIGLEHVGKTALFHVLEKANVKHKWSAGPQAFLPSYTLRSSDPLYGGLSTLCRRRNAHVHSKITLRDESNDIVLAGSTGRGMSIDAESRRLMHRFLRLPYDLHQHLVNQIDDDTLHFKIEHLLRSDRRPLL